MMTLNIRNPQKFELNTYEVIESTKYEIRNPHLYSKDTMHENDYIQLFSYFEYKRSENMRPNSTRERRNHIKENDAHFLYPGEKLLLKTFNNTRQLGRLNIHITMI